MFTENLILVLFDFAKLFSLFWFVLVTSLLHKYLFRRKLNNNKWTSNSSEYLSEQPIYDSIQGYNNTPTKDTKNPQPNPIIKDWNLYLLKVSENLKQRDFLKDCPVLVQNVWSCYIKKTNAELVYDVLLQSSFQNLSLFKDTTQKLTHQELMRDISERFRFLNYYIVKHSDIPTPLQDKFIKNTKLNTKTTIQPSTLLDNIERELSTGLYLSLTRELLRTLPETPSLSDTDTLVGSPAQSFIEEKFSDIGTQTSADLVRKVLFFEPVDAGVNGEIDIFGGENEGEEKNKRDVVGFVRMVKDEVGRVWDLCLDYLVQKWFFD